MNKLDMISELRVIPRGTFIHSIALQDWISFKEPVIIEITKTCDTMNDHFFAKIKRIATNIVGYEKALIDNINGDIDLYLSQTIPYNVPKDVHVLKGSKK